MTDRVIFSNREQVGNSPNTKKLIALLDILVAALPIIVLGLIGTTLGTDTLLGGMLVNLAYVLSIAIAWGILQLRGSGWREIGMARPQSWLRTVLLGIGAMVAGLLVYLAVQVIAFNLPGQTVASIDQSRFNPLAGNLPRLLFMLALAWTTIAFGEEMFFRAFLIDRLFAVFQNTKAKQALAVTGSSVLFGLVHYLDQGPLGMASSAFLGLVWGWAFLRTGRNLWVTLIAHGLLNTLSFILLFSGAA